MLPGQGHGFELPHVDHFLYLYFTHKHSYHIFGSTSEVA